MFDPHTLVLISINGAAGHTCCAIEVEEAAACEVHKLLALAVVVKGDLLCLHAVHTNPQSDL